MKNSSKQDWRALGIPAVILVVLVAVVVGLAPRFVYGSDMLARPIIPFVLTMMVAGGVYLFSAWRSLSLPDSKQVFMFIVVVGVILRALLFYTRPILEDDYYRYLWDGGVTANGFNPYAYTPDDVFLFEGDDVPEELVRLSDEAGRVADRVNHSSLGTVYPPVSQGAFALAHVIAPWNIQSWKFVLLLCDVITFIVLVKLLSLCQLPKAQSLIYWWNPILLKETYNSAHMEMVILPFLMLGLYWLIQAKVYRSGLALACAVGAKLWPVLVIPVLLRANPACPKRSMIALALATAVLVTLLSPMMWAFSLGERSGFIAYGQSWEMNDALFMVVEGIVQLASTPFNVFSDTVEQWSRYAVGAIVFVWLVILLRKPITEVSDLFNRLVLLLGVFFMLSPTQFPWYFLWLLPFLALSPRPSLLLLSVMLPMYYLRFYFSSIDNVEVFHNRLVWVEYAPVLLYSAYELYRYKLAPIPMDTQPRAQ